MQGRIKGVNVMVHHIVLWNLKDELSAHEPDAFGKRLTLLRTQIRKSARYPYYRTAVHGFPPLRKPPLPPLFSPLPAFP